MAESSSRQLPCPTLLPLPVAVSSLHLCRLSHGFRSAVGARLCICVISELGLVSVVGRQQDPGVEDAYRGEREIQRGIVAEVLLLEGAKEFCQC